MDSVSQFALGAAVGVAVMGRRTAVWKAALWGGLCGSLPDLDALIDHGDPIANMTLHRTESHALLYLTLAAPLLAAVIARVQREHGLFKRWWLAVWLALITHPLLDAMTVYGTQFGLPFTDYPWYVGSIFIVDPLYTLPLLVGVGVACAMRSARGLAWNHAGWIVSTLYLGWSALAQYQVSGVAREALDRQGITAERLLVTPTPLNTVLWRVLAITPQGYSEGYHALGEPAEALRFSAYPRGAELAGLWRGNAPAERLAWFSHGFYKTEQRADGRIVMTDLRMGLEPDYTFSFTVAQRLPDGSAVPTSPQMLRSQPDVAAALGWIVRRALGDPAPRP